MICFERSLFCVLSEAWKGDNLNNNEYRYNILLFDGVIVGESLYKKIIGAKKSALIFTRENSSIKIGQSIGKKMINTDVNVKMPFISFLAINYSIEVIQEAMSWFESCIIRSYANPMVERQMLLMENEASKRMLIDMMNDMATMKNTIFRRDEIWFAALNEDNSSEIYSLYDIRWEDNEHINNTAAYDKQYMEGRYGADPYMRNILNWE